MNQVRAYIPLFKINNIEEFTKYQTNQSIGIIPLKGTYAIPVFKYDEKYGFMFFTQVAKTLVEKGVITLEGVLLSNITVLNKEVTTNIEKVYPKVDMLKNTNTTEYLTYIIFKKLFSNDKTFMTELKARMLNNLEDYDSIEVFPLGVAEVKVLTKISNAFIVKTRLLIAKSIPTTQALLGFSEAVLVDTILYINPQSEVLLMLNELKSERVPPLMLLTLLSNEKLLIKYKNSLIKQITSKKEYDPVKVLRMFIKREPVMKKMMLYSELYNWINHIGITNTESKINVNTGGRTSNVKVDTKTLLNFKFKIINIQNPQTLPLSVALLLAGDNIWELVGKIQTINQVFTNTVKVSGFENVTIIMVSSESAGVKSWPALIIATRNKGKPLVYVNPIMVTLTHFKIVLDYLNNQAPKPPCCFKISTSNSAPFGYSHTITTSLVIEGIELNYKFNIKKESETLKLYGHGNMYGAYEVVRNKNNMLSIPSIEAKIKL